MRPVRITAKSEDQILTPFVLPPKNDYSDRPMASHRTKYTRPPPAASVPKSVTATTFTSSSLVEASSGEKEALTKDTSESFSRAPSPIRGTRKTRKRATTIRGEQSFLDMESVTSAATSAASSNVGYASSAVSTGDAEMRRQFKLLERDLGRLKKESQGLRIVSPTTPPPA